MRVLGFSASIVFVCAICRVEAIAGTVKASMKDSRAQLEAILGHFSESEAASIQLIQRVSPIAFKVQTLDDEKKCREFRFRTTKLKNSYAALADAREYPCE